MLSSFLPTTLLLQDSQRCKLIRPNLIQPDPDAQPQSTLEIQRALQEHSRLRQLRGVEPIERAVVTPPADFRRVVAKPRIAKFIPAQGPMD